MISPFIVNDKNLFLDRYPVAQVNRSLQAWDAADEYLINYAFDNHLITDDKTILVMNDNFGALTCNLTQTNVICVNDSFLSQQGIKYNLDQNGLSEDSVTFLSSLDSLPTNIDVVFYKIPKSKSLLAEQLIQLKQTLSSHTLFIASDRAKEIHTSTLKQLSLIHI